MRRSIVPHDFRIWLTVEEVVVAPSSVELSKDIIIIGSLCLWVFKSFSPSNSSIIKKASPNRLLYPTSIPSSLVEGKIIPLNPNGPQCNSSKEEPNSRVFAKRGRDLLAKNAMVPMESFPRSFLIRMSFHGVNDANGIIPSSPCKFAIPKPVCNGLRNVECTHEAFVIDFIDKPNSPRVKGHHLVPKWPNKIPFLRTPHFIPNIPPFKLLESLLGLLRRLRYNDLLFTRQFEASKFNKKLDHVHRTFGNNLDFVHQVATKCVCNAHCHPSFWSNLFPCNINMTTITLRPTKSIIFKCRNRAIGDYFALLTSVVRV